MTSPAKLILTGNSDPCWDRGLIYGDGVFETMAVFDGTMPLGEYHLARLKIGLERLHIQVDIVAVEAHFQKLARQADNGILRVVLARSGGPRGYDPRQATELVLQSAVFPLPAYSKRLLVEGAVLHVCEHRLSVNPVLAGIKHLNRLDQVLAAAEWGRAGAQEGLMLDTAGRVTEGTFSNIFMVQDGVFLTPDLSQCGVEGVMRARLIEQLLLAGYAVKVCAVSLQEIHEAEAVFMCNSVLGAWPVRAVGDVDLRISPEYVEKVWSVLRPLGYERLYA
jgi:4-amino-4-deoxychorismate lyase